MSLLDKSTEPLFVILASKMNLEEMPEEYRIEQFTAMRKKLCDMLYNNFHLNADGTVSFHSPITATNVGGGSRQSKKKTRKINKRKA